MATVTRPAGGYTPSNPITNTTKYQDDSAATSPKVAISSDKVDGDINKAFDELTNQSNRLDKLDAPIANTTAATIAVGDTVVFADASDSNAIKRSTVQGIVDLTSTPDGSITTAKLADGAVTVAKQASGAATATQALFANGSGGAAYRGVAASDLPAATDTAQGAVELATADEVRAGTDTARTAPVSNMGAHAGIAKAWYCGSISGGTLTTLASYNCSVVRNNTGRFTLTFTNAMQDANYAPIGMVQISAGLSLMYIPGATKNTTTLQFAVDVTGGGANDPSQVYLAVFGN